MTTAPSKVRITHLATMKKEGRRIAMVTAYDALSARWVDLAGVEVILVGDSLGNTALGLPDTIGVTMEAMIHHSQAVSRGAQRALIVADMPFMSYKINAEQAMEQAARLIQSGKAEAVKLEGGSEIAPTVERLVQAGLPVMGHVGLLPQSVHAMGGYRVQGKGEAGGRRLLDDARSLEQAGAFCVVLEGIPAAVAAEITRELTIPTIGIGAGRECDGQVLVLADLLGMSGQPSPRLARQYVDLSKVAVEAIGEYARQVRENEFPGDENIYA